MKKKLYYNCIKWCFITACVMNANNGKAQANYDIYLFDVKAGTTKQLTHTADGGEWNASWSNSGKKITEGLPY